MGYEQIPEPVESHIDAIVGNVFADSVRILSDSALDLAGKKFNYTDMDLFNASLIFMEVFMSKFYDYFKGKGLTKEQLEWAAHSAGTQFHKVIETFTGIDLKRVME
jgi:hypothetical protein